MMDMHAMFYDFPRDFSVGRTGRLRPLATHLRMVVDYCHWNGRVVIASDDTSIMRNPPAGQSQSNLWFIKADEIGRLGPPAGWGGPWVHDRVQADVPCDPFLVKGFTRRCLHLATESPRTGGVAKRCTDRFEIAELPPALRELTRVTIARGDYHQPAPGYAFTVNGPVVVFIGVDDRSPAGPEGWVKTGMSLQWQGHTDSVYKRTFQKGRVEVPGHDAEHGPGAYPLPNICFVCDASSSAEGLEITGLPNDKGVEVARPRTAAPAASGPVTFTVEIDRDGGGKWSQYKTIRVPAEAYTWHVFPADLDACWVRLKADSDCTATAMFHCSSPGRAGKGPQRVDRDAKLFQGLADVGAKCARSEGIVRPAGGDNRNLQFLARSIGEDGKASDAVLYEVDERLTFRPAGDAEAAAEVLKKADIRRDFTVDAASAIISQGQRTYRLPKGDAAYDKPFASGWPRGLREVITERNLLNCHGTFYEVPRADSAGIAGMRPIASHGKGIHDFCTWRGVFVMSGMRAAAEADGHFFGPDGKAGLWFGAVDDLWKFPKPTGVGGPWRQTEVKASSPSDPYLMTGLDRKRVELSHDAAGAVKFAIEVDVIADGTWWPYKTVEVPPGRTVGHEFADGFSARWVRVTA
ncbi:MAG: sulfatase, partial [Phycisphaerae bacterium]